MVSYAVVDNGQGCLARRKLLIRRPRCLSRDPCHQYGECCECCELVALGREGGFQPDDDEIWPPTSLIIKDVGVGIVVCIDS